MKNILLFFVIALFMDGVFGETVSVMEGDSVTLHTGLSEIQTDDVIQWRFKTELIAQFNAVKKKISLYDVLNVRFKDRLKLDNQTGDLTIRNITTQHAGDYEVTNLNTLKRSFSVSVVSVDVSVAAVKSVSVLEGDSVTVQTGLTEIQRDDVIQWSYEHQKSEVLQKSPVAKINRDGGIFETYDGPDDRFGGRLKLDHRNGFLTITNIKTTDSGLYEVEISRSRSSYIIHHTQSFRVTVRVTDAVKSLSVTEGETVTLQINVTEIQKDDLIHWMFEGTVLAEINKEDQTGSLIITNTRTTDSGLYEVEIISSRHIINRRFTVIVTALPDPGLSPAAVAGIGVGGGLLLAAAGVFYYLYKKSKTVTGQSLMEGDSVTLCTGLTEIQRDHMIEWWYEVEGSLIAKINGNSRETYDGADGRFRSKLSLNAKGDLTISNSRTIHSGLYQLKIRSNMSCRGTITRKPIYKRFSVTISVKSEQVKEGDSVSFQTEAQIQTGDLILWTFGASNILVIRSELTGTESIHEDFRDRLELDHQNGDLTIRNITVKDSGHFKLQIINHQKTTFRRFNVAVNASTGNQVSESVNVVMPLLSGDAADGENKQQETSSL